MASISLPAAIKDRLHAAPLHWQLRRLRWFIPLLVFALAALHLLLLATVNHAIPAAWQPLAGVAVFGVTGSLVSWIGLTWIASAAAARSQVAEQLRTAYSELEATHKKLLTLHELGQRITTAGDEQAVLELAALAPLQLTEASASSVVTFDGEQNRLKLDMSWGLSEDYLRALRASIDAGLDAERCRNCTTLQTHVGSDCPLFTGLHSIARAEGIGSLTCMPIVREQERVGIISAYFPSVDGPPEDQLRLLNILSGAIAAMLENLRTRSRQVTTLHALDQAAQSADALDDFAAEVLDIVLAGWDAQVGGLFTYQADTQTWNPRAERGLGENMTSPYYALALKLARQAHAQSAPVIVLDLGEVNGAGLLSAAAAPLISDNETLGAIFMGARRRRAFNERHTDLLRTMAHQTALAIRNAQLYARLGQMAILEERYRLSREIHDGLAQTLAYMGLQAERMEALIANGRGDEAAREAAEMRQLARAAYVDAREAIDGLRLSLDDPGLLAERLAVYFAEFTRQSGIPVQFDSQPPDLRVAPSAGLQLMRIAQEALTNVRKHAQASQVQVRLSAAGEELELTLADDGRGFPDALHGETRRRSYGLTTMRERAQSMGGALAVATGPGQGTRIVVTVPRKAAL